ncbi:hypothetical protein [Tuberibacillus sp. Marseille-P3662]|uniref:hypothetical protein n=1 Tax=Tuberibacillus sp. Marseille-P3662 TaxID=1965358 RepID=UPI000A1C9B98|nr:hypothetical protein [Tuberibacillus sp. Marseille-P3662]
MIVLDELSQRVHFELPLNHLIETLQLSKRKKGQEIEKIKEKINQYEQKKQGEKAFYQSLSPLRKFFAGRPPSHHQAVEHLVYVKEPLKRIETINQRIRELDDVINLLQEDASKNEIVLSTSIIDELKSLRQTEER